MSLSINIGRPFLNDKTLDEQARSVLRLYGTNAHVYLPGANGVAVSGLPTNNYTLSNGSTGYSAVDGTTGLVLDAMGSVGAELFTGAFTRYNTVESDTTTVPALCTSTGVFSVVGISKSATANMPYRCSVTWSGNTTGRTIQVGGGTGIATLGTAVSGSATFTVVPSSVSMYIYFTASAAGQAVSFDSFSARPISGIHATQSTTANKPAERRGLYNLLTYSNDLSNAAWSATGVTKGTNVITEDTATSMHGLARFTTWPAATAATGAFIVSAGTATKCWIGNASAATASCFNLTTGTVEGNIGSIVGSITSLGGGQYLIAAQHTASVAQTFALGMYTTFVSGNYASTISYLGTSRTLNVASGGLFNGTLTAAQILAEGGIPLTTSTAASNSGAGRYWLDDDGTKSLVIGSVPFQMSDDHAVIAGFRLGANATTRYAVNAAAGAGSQRVGAIYINDTNTIGAGWTDDVAAANITSPSTYTGQTVVASAVKQTNAKRLRVNGAQAGATNNTVMGTTTLTAGGAIGDWKSGGGNQLSGSIGPVVLIKGTISDSDLLTLERWVASNTLGAPSF